eukprot:SAG31_NODE_16948_length_689_cov_1.322034_2_plen_118_part_01
MSDPATIAEARSEPLWYNSLLQTGHGIWFAEPKLEREDSRWKAWATAGVRAIADITTPDGSFVSYAILCRRYYFRKRMCTATEYTEIIRRVQQSRVGDWLRGLNLSEDRQCAWHYDAD